MSLSPGSRLHLAMLYASADQAVASRQEKDYRGAREVELRDQAVKCLRELLDHHDMQRTQQLQLHLANVARPIVEEIDELHAIALNLSIDAARSVA